MSNWKLSCALTATVAMVVAGFANAAVVEFQNPAGPGHYDWVPGVDESRWLDITQSAANQANADTFSALRQDIFSDGSSQLGSSGNPGEMRIELAPPLDFFPAGHAENTEVPSGLNTATGALIVFPGFGEAFPEGEPHYLGVQFDLGGGTQYGWIGVTRIGLELDAFAWAYETEPGVAIVTPEPGAISMLLLGAGMLTTRRFRGA